MTHALVVHLLDVSLRSLWMAVPVAAFAWMLRARRAAVAHSLWTILLAGMLTLFALGPTLPALPLRILPMDRSNFAAAPHGSALGEIALLLYAAVALAGCGRLLAGWWLARRLLSCSVPLADERFSRAAAPVRESAAVSVPLTIGWLRPKILLPAGWRAWEDGRLRAVLAHESAHALRRDSLIVFLAGLNRSLFWFHPLAWWVERRLALLAEQACDEASLAATGDRHGYASLLLEMANAMKAAGGRISWRALAMATGSHIRRRIESVLDGPSAPSPLTRNNWIALLACAAPLAFAIAAVRLEARPPLLALDFPAFTAPAPPANPALPGRESPRAMLRAYPLSGERALYAAVEREADPQRKLVLLKQGEEKYPHSRFPWLQLSLNTYSQLNDIPNLLAALNQMGREEFLRTLRIDPAQAEADFEPAPEKVSKTLFYYARAAAYDGPGALAPEGRQEVEDLLRQAYNNYYGRNEAGLDELKRLAKSYPFPPEYFQIALLPPPNRTFDSSLAAASSSIHIRNMCPYGLRIDCNGPERKRTWIPAGRDSQLVVTPGTYQIFAADLSGVSSFTGPGRFDPQFDYAYTLTVKRD